uniref:Uncharacterized protein n=1 Tax=Globisporangium ultimum (strain ATCC 200006 / CBS 805.95 / DAOM BR144) TaxID=431595 RepID=K3WEE1_GLOUD
MNDFMFLRCCLKNLLLAFIKGTLGDHGEVCMSTCDAEDLCTLAFQLATALSTSVPAALQCANLFVSANVVSLSGDINKVKEDPVYSSCLLLAMQLQNMYEQIGGPNEKAPHLSLPEFDYSAVKRSNTFKNASTETLDRSDGTTPFVQALFEKMLMSIEDSSNRSASLDFVMLSQSTWELIHEIEGNEGQSSSLSPLESTSIFGKLMYQLVASKRSRLDDPEFGAVDAATPTTALKKTFPSDAKRKLMNQFYKKYCACLGLKASPTSLHRIMKHFGQCTIGTFPVTMLMILGEFCTEKETIAFLSSVWMSRSVSFLWPTAMSSTSSNHDEGTALSVFSDIAVAVEYILRCEYPQ